jgi:spermidine synthase
MGPVLYLLFCLSGVSGLIYQVIWVREFGNVFGNTIYSASLVVAIFMLGLGAGGSLVGAWADRRYTRAPDSLLHAYAWFELIIAGLALAVSLVLPSLDAITAAVSSYQLSPSGWYELSPASYAARAAIAVALLAPITLLMGGTLTLLIRSRVGGDVGASGRTIALLYGVNTLGAAAGALATDFALVPAVGFFGTQMVAVALNVAAGVGALVLVRLKPETTTALVRRKPDTTTGRVRLKPDQSPITNRQARIVYTSIALALTGFTAMGLEILWLRHFTLMLGGFRAVFSLLLTMVLLGIGIGALIGGLIDRRTARPAAALMLVQALMVAAALIGLAAADVTALQADARAIDAVFAGLAPWRRTLAELWFNARPMLVEVGVPALLMGCSFPLANALVQDAERAVGARAGLLYLANTAGAVCGSLVAGEVLLQTLGIQQSATALACAGAFAIPLIHLADRQGARSTRDHEGPRSRENQGFAIASGALAGIAILAWTLLPATYLLTRSLVPPGPGERVIAVSEGAIDLIAIAEMPGRGRALMTNGHAMSSTALLDQRYMRALAHIPLLAIDRPARVLVIGFGVGNTTHAATLHPSVARVEVADLSRHVLEHAGYFADANRGVLKDRKVSVFLNDGRQHLRMQSPGSYDLITLEPPPVAQAGVAALYSREFYTLARSRLTPGGYVSQWLPAYQVPAASSLAMVRAFLDVFPNAVLLSGSQAELLLIGSTGARVEVDPDALAARLHAAPAVAADLRRLDLGTPTELVGTFVGSPHTLALATRGAPPVTDDRPLQEYGVRSVLGGALLGVPASLLNLDEVASWCPRCFRDGAVAPSVEGLDTYMTLLGEAYSAPVSERAMRAPRRLLDNAYLGAVVPETPEVRTIVAQAQYETGASLLDAGRFQEAAAQFRAALTVMPDSAGLHNNLGVALASMGRVAEAREHFSRAVALEPDFAEARRNLAAAGGARRF